MVGVYYDETCSRPFRASCMVMGSTKHIGQFHTELEAHTAYCSVKEKEIRRVANMWKPFICGRAYRLLKKYRVGQDD